MSNISTKSSNNIFKYLFLLGFIKKPYFKATISDIEKNLLFSSSKNKSDFELSYRKIKNITIFTIRLTN